MYGYSENSYPLLKFIVVIFLLYIIPVLPQAKTNHVIKMIDTNSFQDCSHHWYDISDGEEIISPEPDQKKYKTSEITGIADNILLYQKTNGGWPKNYDMLAVLSPKQKEIILNSKNDSSVTTFDNEATHSHVEYLAKAFSLTKKVEYKKACLNGIEFILRAQYPNGGWPQFFPDTSGYRKYITFNDNAMTGNMNVLLNIIKDDPEYSFVSPQLKERILASFNKGIECILKCQINENGKVTVWCQQHDNIGLFPRDARKFEPAAICNCESADIVLLLMRIDKPNAGIINSIQNAVKWFNESKIMGLRVKEIDAPFIKYKYHETSKDKVVVQDPTAPPIWTRYYELGTHRSVFCNRDSKPVYTLADVDRERRTGYRWYLYDPQKVLNNYPTWQKKYTPEKDVLKL